MKWVGSKPRAREAPKHIPLERRKCVVMSPKLPHPNL